MSLSTTAHSDLLISLFYLESASEMTYVVSGGALNSTHSPIWLRIWLNN